MVHFADHLPHNRKAASKGASNSGYTGSFSASPLTARLRRLKDCGRATKCNGKNSFDSHIANLYQRGDITEIQNKVLSNMDGFLSGLFHHKSLTMFVILNEYKTEIKELIWVDVDTLQNKRGDEIAASLKALCRLKWLERANLFTERPCAD